MTATKDPHTAPLMAPIATLSGRGRGGLCMPCTWTKGFGVATLQDQSPTSLLVRPCERVPPTQLNLCMRQNHKHRLAAVVRLCRADAGTASTINTPLTAARLPTSPTSRRQRWAGCPASCWSRARRPADSSAPNRRCGPGPAGWGSSCDSRAR